MTFRTLNILLTTFRGLGLPSTICMAVESTTPISELLTQILSCLPNPKCRLIITTTSNRALEPASTAHISTLLLDNHSPMILLRLTVPVLGGKGGFGSQLRAAGGRMSSKRKKHQGDNNGSSRNLDGRRLRTVTEAKALAEYLAVKPEMDKKEKEARRKRWEQVIELAEKQEDDIKYASKGRVDGNWVEDKEDAAEKTRGAVVAAMSSGACVAGSFTHVSNPEAIYQESDSSVDEKVVDNFSTRLKTRAVLVEKTRVGPLFHGFDDESSDDGEE